MGIAFLANASMALALSAHTPSMQLSVYNVNASWHSEFGQDTPSRYLAIGWNTCTLYTLCIVYTRPVCTGEARQQQT